MSKPKAKDNNELFETPFALSIGPQRAGTSWLDRYLRSRNDICVPDAVKEIFFFDRHYNRGISFYTSHFKPQKQHKTAIEITTTAFDHDGAAQRVLETCGRNIRLICPLRNPLTRSYSLYMHYKRYGIIFGDLEEACQQNPQIIESSRYAKHLQQWFDVFGAENIKILFQEDLEVNQDAYVRDVCQGLGVNYIPLSEELTDRFNATTSGASGAFARMIQRLADWLRQHKCYFVINLAKALGLKKFIFGDEKPQASGTSIPDDDRAYLEAHLKGEIEKLEAMIGPIPQWK
ncbi:MAG: sulfotransferase domain-containing protein [Alphaproteobacteria bacterium]